jgi:hypothetical protein
MIFKVRWKSISRAIIVISVAMVISLWTNIAAAGLHDVLIKAAEQGDISAVKSVIDGGADVNAKMNDGMTSLMYASLGGHLEIVRTLIARGADVNARTNDGVSSLMYASLGGHLEIVRTLISRGADVNAKTNGGWTVLMVASMGGHREVVQELLLKGVDVNAKSRYGWTALSIASMKVHPRVEELLKEAGTQVKDIPHSAKPVEGVLQPAPTVPSPDSVSPLSGSEQVTADRVAPGQTAAHTKGGNLSQPASAQVPIAIPVILPVAKPAVTPTAPVRSTVPEPAQTDAPSSTPRAPSAEVKELEQKHVYYTLSAGETVNRPKLDVLVKKLKASGLKPVVREENKNMDVFRLVSECFNAGNAAQKHLTKLARKEKQVFIVRDGEQFCVAIGSFFSYEAALTGQNRLVKKDLQSEIVKAQVPLTIWQVTVGRYNDSQSATAELKRLAERGINVVVMQVSASY